MLMSCSSPLNSSTVISSIEALFTVELGARMLSSVLRSAMTRARNIAGVVIGGVLGCEVVFAALGGRDRVAATMAAGDGPGLANTAGLAGGAALPATALAAASGFAAILDLAGATTAGAALTTTATAATDFAGTAALVPETALPETAGLVTWAGLAATGLVDAGLTGILTLTLASFVTAFPLFAGFLTVIEQFTIPGYLRITLERLRVTRPLFIPQCVAERL